MRFQFCGNVACPEWFLAESAIISKITAIKVKLVSQQIIKHLLEDVENAEKIIGYLEGSGFTKEEIHSAIASIEFILSNSVCYDIADNILIKELTDLGLPKENVEQIAKVYKLNKDKLKSKKLKSILRISKVKDINYSVSKFIVSNEKSAFDGEEVQDYPSKYADLNIKWITPANNQQNTQKFVIFQDKLNELVYELEKGLSIMDKFQ